MPWMLERAAKINVSPPTRPKNISAIRIRCDIRPSCGVIPSERPTVPMAEAVSKRQSRTGRFSSLLMISPPVKNRIRYIIITVAA